MVGSRFHRKCYLTGASRSRVELLLLARQTAWTITTHETRDHRPDDLPVVERSLPLSLL